MDFYINEKGETVQAQELSSGNVTILSSWTNGMVVNEYDPFDNAKSQPGLNVQCGYTVKRASLGDFVIKYSDGRFDVLKPNEFYHYFKAVQF